DSRAERLKAQLDKKKQDTDKAAIEQEDQQARGARGSAAIDRAENALIEAKRTGAAEPLLQARAALADAKRDIRAEDPRIERVEARIDALAQERRVRFWELWGVVGLAAIGVIVALVLYLMRSKRVLEMIEGAQAGQVFALEKEATSLGALA